MNYFVIMTDLGRQGLEAIVHPEDTRREMTARVREYLGDGKEIAFVHEVCSYADGLPMITTDITEEVIDEARSLMAEAAE
jgi:hypothetical protein